MEQNLKSVQDKITNCLGNKEAIQKTLYMLSHICFATIIVMFLKKYQPIVLAIILAGMLGFISYTEQTTFPIYVLPSMGVAMYLFDFFIISSYSEENINKTTLDVLKKTIWKIPYYGIIIYYVGMFI